MVKKNTPSINLGREKYGSQFSLNPDDRDILHKLISYAISSEGQCEYHGLDLNKGILLTGPVGWGKTSLISLHPNFMFLQQKFLVKTRVKLLLNSSKMATKSFIAMVKEKSRFVLMISE